MVTGSSVFKFFAVLMMYFITVNDHVELVFVLCVLRSVHFGRHAPLQKKECI